MEPADEEDVRSLMIGVMNVDAKLDTIIYLLTEDDDEEEEYETDGRRLGALERGQPSACGARRHPGSSDRGS